MTAQVEELGGDTVRLKVDVPAHDVHHAVEHATSDLAQSVKIPGFRQGKVPVPILDAAARQGADHGRGGRQPHRRLVLERRRPRPHPAGRAAAVRLRAPDAEDDADWQFTATVPVQPKVDVVDWTELEVGKPEAEVPEELVTQELEALRESVAELVPAGDRPAQEGDTLVVDIVSPEGEAQRDTVVELGAGRLVEEVEAALVGASAGETKSVELRARGRVDLERRRSRSRRSARRCCPSSTTSSRARRASSTRSASCAPTSSSGCARPSTPRSRTPSAPTRSTRSSPPRRSTPAGPLVESRTRELLTGFIRSLERRGIAPETYLQLTGRSAEELTSSMQMEAALSVARELALEAVADKLGIEVSDDEVKELIREQAEAAGEDPDEVIEDLWQHGRQEDLREDLRLRAALDRVAAEVKPIPLEQAQARDAIWTPDKETPEQETKLWTPGN